MKKKDIISNLSKGFTLVELLLTITVISILFLVIIVGLNIPKRIEDVNNARRIVEMRTILNATHQYIIDHKGNLPPGLGENEQQIGTSVTGCVNLNRGCDVLQSKCLNLAEPLLDYLQVFPFDPKIGSNSKTSYSIVIAKKNIVTVKACASEGEGNMALSQ